MQTFSHVVFQTFELANKIECKYRQCLKRVIHNMSIYVETQTQEPTVMTDKCKRWRVPELLKLQSSSTSSELHSSSPARKHRTPNFIFTATDNCNCKASQNKLRVREWIACKWYSEFARWNGLDQLCALDGWQLPPSERLILALSCMTLVWLARPEPIILRGAFVHELMQPTGNVVRFSNRQTKCAAASDNGRIRCKSFDTLRWTNGRHNSRYGRFSFLDQFF